MAVRSDSRCVLLLVEQCRGSRTTRDSSSHQSSSVQSESNTSSIEEAELAFKTTAQPQLSFVLLSDAILE